MRRTHCPQARLDCDAIAFLELNLQCRDEIIPILSALKHIYLQSELRTEILQLVAGDVNADSRSDHGREGLDYWQILVLAAVFIHKQTSKSCRRSWPSLACPNGACGNMPSR
jgi:hypothetical protein